MEPKQTKGHAELEQYHYQALSNPLYVLEGLADVMREELMMNMPILPLPSPAPGERIVIHRHSNMSAENWDLLQQTALRVGHLEKKLAERRKPKRYQQYKVDNPRK